ncbi:MAG: sigma 54-interacting transcriptional regulator [Polyangiaceae bacterium]
MTLGEQTADLSLVLGPAGIRAKLVVLDGAEEGIELPLNGALIVGADPAASIVLTDSTVSRRHAEFSLRAGRVLVRDLGSRNGTFLGSSRITEAELALGSVVRLGATSIGIYPGWMHREVQPGKATRFGELLGRSVRMREIFAILERVAPTDVTVLVEGESGTGKELVARSVHAASLRSERPLVVFDCAAVPRNLAESELFGHKRGAFSGAVADRAGAFHQAHGGTIFLDEIGELPLDLQPRLLRVLETGQVRRVGDDTMRQVDVRVIAATNRDLHAEVRRGAFRSDLLYRLEVVKVTMPPLRHRPEDLADIIEAMLAAKLAPGDSIAGESLRRLMAYSWPGNVRELRNVLERAVALAGPTPHFANLVFSLGPAAEGPAHIGQSYPGVASPVPYREARDQVLSSFDRAYVDALLARHRGNISRAAEAAGLSRKHLYAIVRRLEGATEDEE